MDKSTEKSVLRSLLTKAQAIVHTCVHIFFILSILVDALKNIV